MPSKKKKYNARFPAGRIKKIMQSDEEIGKVAQAVPVIISRTLELFVESLLTKTLRITNSRNAKTLSPSHMKQCIMSEARFDFLRELVKNIPDISVAEEAANYIEDDARSSPDESYPDSDTPYDLSMPSTSSQAYRNNNGPQNGCPYKPPQNGGSQMKCETEVRQRLRQKITASLETTMSNPMHGLKLNRSDSSPAATFAATPPIAEQWFQQQQQQHQLMLQRQRLKQQSHSFPNSDSNANAVPTKRAKSENVAAAPPMQQQQPETAISAPIVSFDFCNKPVVKIDYSNLPLSNANAAPLSAPAATGVGGFNFSDVAPVINIDLSNIVPTPLPANGPAAMATISIGAIPNAVATRTTPATIPNAAANATTKLATSPLTAITPDPQATMTVPFTLSQSSKSTAAAAAASAASAAQVAKSVSPTESGVSESKNSFLELDEDDDNI